MSIDSLQYLCLLILLLIIAINTSPTEKQPVKQAGLIFSTIDHGGNFIEFVELKTGQRFMADVVVRDGDRVFASHKQTGFTYTVN